MRKAASLALGWLFLLAAGAGILLPLLPTVPFLLLAAFFFSKGSSTMEAWLIDHRHFGPPIRAWRAERSISRKGKRAACVMFALSAIAGILTLAPPWRFLPLLVAIAGSAWILTRPTSASKQG